MKREIKFRGKRKNGEEILIGDLVRTCNGGPCIFPSDDSLCLNSPDYYEVDENTIGQYTGHKDKKGNEIYEGDILKFFDKIVAIVVWKEFGGWSYRWVDQTYINVRQINPEPFFHNINLNEVVGNIFENPELIPSAVGV